MIPMIQSIQKLSLWILVLSIIRTAYCQNNSTVCYGDLGCFYNGPPWSGPQRFPINIPPPQDPQTVNTSILCYTGASNQTYNVTLRPLSLGGCPYNGHTPFVFITHGFLSNAFATWLDTLKNYYLAKKNATICKVNWAGGADNFNYLQDVSNARIMGAEVARFCRYLIATYGLKPKYLHFIGFSLGAHGFAYTSNNLSNGAGRITAMDPAGPAYENADPIVRLDKTDAVFVDVLHTSAAPLIPCYGFGYMEPAGDVDFYFNGGNDQPLCPLNLNNTPAIVNYGDLTSSTFQEIFFQSIFCSHARSFMYFISAVGGNCNFTGHKTTYNDNQVVARCIGLDLVNIINDTASTCTNATCNYVGLDTPLYPARGVFSVITSGIYPFCAPRT